MTEIQEHTIAAEILIVVSQTTFFIMFFLILKHGIIDKNELMTSLTKAKENVIQLSAVYFAILTIIGLVMIPLQSYEYGHIVLVCTIISIVLIFIFEFKKLNFIDDPENDKKHKNNFDTVSKTIFIRNHASLQKKQSPTQKIAQVGPGPSLQINQPSDGFEF